MTINFHPLTKHDVNQAKAIDLFFEAFPKVQRLPPWIVKCRMRNSKAGFHALYDRDTWIGFIYLKEFKDIVFVKFFAISEQRSSCGYGSTVMDLMKSNYAKQRIVLNIEELDDTADNYQQRIKRKAFYEKNDFCSTGYMVKEPAEKQEMLICGGSISKEEIDDMYKHFLGNILYSLLKPEVIEI